MVREERVDLQRRRGIGGWVGWTVSRQYLDLVTYHMLLVSPRESGRTSFA
jgi:hypothetical protein